MSVLIKGMTLDELSDYGEYCQTLIGTGQAIELPPHGRLIDADAFFDDLLFPSKQFEQGIRELIGDAPTVIPAEETLKEATNDQNNS